MILAIFMHNLENLFCFKHLNSIILPCFLFTFWFINISCKLLHCWHFCFCFFLRAVSDAIFKFLWLLRLWFILGIWSHSTSYFRISIIQWILKHVVIVFFIIRFTWILLSSLISSWLTSALSIFIAIWFWILFTCFRNDFICSTSHCFWSTWFAKFLSFTFFLI